MSGRAPAGGSAGDQAVAVRPERARALAVARRHEGLAAAVAATLAAALLFGPHVAAGGRYLDDWWLGVYVRYPRALGFHSALDYLDFYSGPRPGAVAYWLVTYKLLAFHDALQRGLAAALAALLAGVFYTLLRELRLSRRDAAAITLLSLVLPIADSIHFWLTPDVAQLCLAACAGGLLLGLRALGAHGPRALRLRIGALALYATSMLIAETMVAAIGLSLLLYLTRAPRRRAVAHWLPAGVLAALAAAHYALDAPARRTAAAGHTTYLHHAGVLADQAATLLAGSLVPFATSRAWVLVIVLGLVAAAGVRLRRGAEARWLVAAALAAVLAATSYLIYVPSDPSYQPLVPGIGNRVNIGALLPFSVLLFAVARLAGGLCRGARAAGAVTALIWVVVAAGGLGRLTADRWLWDQAAEHQAAVLDALHAALPDPPAGAALLVFHAPGVVTRFQRVGVDRVNVPVPVFSTWWELDAAVKLSFGRSDLDAYPIWSFQAPQVSCGAHYVYQLGLDGVRHALAYGHVYVVDVAVPSAVRLVSPDQCSAVISAGSTIRYDLPV